MKSILQFSFILVIIASITCIELNMIDLVMQDVLIEMIDFHEEGSGEKDTQETSKEEVEIDFAFGVSQYAHPPVDCRLNSSDLYRIKVNQSAQEIVLPPPEYV